MMNVLRDRHTLQARGESSVTLAPPRIDRLVVATAGDAASLGAIRVGVELARRAGASVVAVGVRPPAPLGVRGPLASSALATEEDGRLELLGVVRSTLAEIPGTELWEKRAVINMPAMAINELAGDDSRTMILMGLGHHGRLGRLFGGETTVPVIKHARVPVLVVESAARTLPRHAVAAVDFTEASLAAAAVAGEILDDDSTLMVAHVSAFGDANAQPGDLMDLYRAGVRARLDQAVQRLQRRTHRRVEGVTLHGEIAQSLLDFADATKCDLIALGGHELGLVDRVLLGSVRTTVVRAAKCSVLIAPPEKHGADL
jgi:nucleotide-binding universal stress UspA family protein